MKPSLRRKLATKLFFHSFIICCVSFSSGVFSAESTSNQNDAEVIRALEAQIEMERQMLEARPRSKPMAKARKVAIKDYGERCREKVLAIIKPSLT